MCYNKRILCYAERAYTYNIMINISQHIFILRYTELYIPVYYFDWYRCVILHNNNKLYWKNTWHSITHDTSGYFIMIAKVYLIDIFFDFVIMIDVVRRVDMFLKRLAHTRTLLVRF